MIDLIAHFRTFLRVAEAGSFTAVAREQAATQPTISRQIAALEAHLGARLFQRTTRALSLTDDGRAFYEEARRAVEAVAGAEAAVGRRKGRPSGTLRLACAVVMGRLHVIPRLPRFLAAHPDVAVDLVMGDGFADMVGEGIDLAIRVGELTDPGLVARRIGTTRRVVVATPGYLARRGTPETPQDLRGHDCILYGGLATGAAWPFTRDGVPLSVPVSGRFRVDNTEGVRAAILNGLGIGIVPVWHFVADEIARGALRVLLADYEPVPNPINAVHPSRRFVPAKVRAMIDFLAAEFARDPALGGREGGTTASSGS